MGYVKVRVRIANVHHPERSEELELLVDSGANYTMVSREILKRLDILPLGKEKFKLADGSIIDRDSGWMWLEVSRHGGYTKVVFGEKGDASVLGVYSLEGLGLKVNSLSGELEPMELLLL